MRTQLRHLWREVDDRLGDAPAPPLLSVSQTLGVVRRELISDKPPRADSFNKYKICEAGDVVLNRFNAYRGSLGISNERGIVSPDYLVLRANPNSHPKFLDFLLRSEKLSNFMKSTMGGLGASDPDVSGFSRIDVASLGQYSVPTLDFQKQRAIASFLDRQTAEIDALIGKQERFLELLGEKRQAIITRAVTKGLDPAAPTKSSGIPWVGDIPAHWRVSKIKYVKSPEANAFVDGPFGSNLKSEHFVVNGDALVIESNFATTGKLVEAGLKTIAEHHFQTISRSEVRAGDIVIAKIGARFGSSAILPEISKKAVVSGNSMKLTINGKISSASWIAQQLDLQKTVGDLDHYASVTAQPALSLGGVNQLAVLVPPINEQNQILEKISKSSELFARAEAAARRLVNLLQERRSALISAAVTGKIDVREGAA